MNSIPCFGTCRACGKQTWVTRREARRAIRRLHPGAALHIYPCPTSTGFHLGHLRPAVVRGRLTRDDAYRKKTPA